MKLILKKKVTKIVKRMTVIQKVTLALRKAGASKDVMEKTLSSLSPAAVERKLTRKEIVRIDAALNEHGRVVVVRGPSKIKVFTLQGHKGAVKAAKANKPWMSKKA